MFEGTLESLSAYRCPEWFRDAKFGMYVHWGVYSVAGRGAWFPRMMYQEENKHYWHFLRTYGHPSKTGYKDFIEKWKAENFDPHHVVGLFKAAGARYFCPCAVHHDNFDLWDSKHHRYNSVNMGPRKDITAMWREATLAQGLHFGVTTHLARAYSWFNTNKRCDLTGPYRGVPYDGADPEYAEFYFGPHDDYSHRHPQNPPEIWRRNWSMRIKDLIDNYHPEHLYFDGAVPFLGDDQARTGLDVIAHFYNHSCLGMMASSRA